MFGTLGEYKHGKQKEIIGFSKIKMFISKAKLPMESEAFFWILYYCGCRKSEAYERAVEDLQLNIRGDDRRVVNMDRDVLFRAFP